MTQPDAAQADALQADAAPAAAPGAFSPGQPRKFTFDTVFDGDRVIAPIKPKQVFTPDDVQAARAQGFAEGQRSVQSRADADAAAAISEVAGAIRAAMPALSALAQEHKAGAARLALACGRCIADAALDQFPDQPAAAALEALAREIEAHPRLVVRAPPGDLSRLEASLARAAEAAGCTGQVVVKADAALPPAAFTFDWGEGRAAFDPQAAAARVEAALEQALAAERLHAQPLPITPEVRP